MKRLLDRLCRPWDDHHRLGFFIFLVFLVFQVADGYFTYWGVTNIGIGLEIEDNPIVRKLMEMVGPGLGLIIVKIIAIIASCYFYICKQYTVLIIFVIIYFFIAILPWLIIFLF